MRKILYFHREITNVVGNRHHGIRRYLHSAKWDVKLVELNIDSVNLREILPKLDPVGCLVERGATRGKSPSRFFRGIPTVYLDSGAGRTLRNEISLRYDPDSVAEAALKELVSDNPRHLAYVPDRRGISWSMDRGKAFRQLARTKGFKTTVLDCDLRQLPEELKKLPAPCGIFAANDTVAKEVLLAAQLADLDVPAELRVIGVNNDVFICENSIPELSSIQPDFEQCGYLAAAALHNFCRGLPPKSRNLTYGTLTTVRRASTRSSGITDARVAKALEILRNEYANPYLGSENLAARIGCSRRILDLRFRETTGETIRGTLRTIRLDAAKKLLLSREREISAIPSLCGYSSSSTFMHEFKRATGLTMSAWRNQPLT